MASGIMRTFLGREIFLLLIVTVCSAADVYISQTTGHNVKGCGNISNPCSSLEFAVRNVGENDFIVLYLHGGDEVQSRYIVKNPLKLNRRSAVIKKQLGSKKIPVISSEKIHSNINLFALSPGMEQTTVELESLEIQNLKIWSFEKCKVNITINNCKIVTARDHMQNHMNPGTEMIATSVLHITNTRIFCHNNYFLSDTYQPYFRNIVIRDSVLCGCSMWFNSTSNQHSLNLDIENSTFRGSRNRYVAVYISTWSRIILRSVKFINIDGFSKNKALIQVTIPNMLQRNSITSILFHDIAFQHNRNIGYLFYVENTHVNGKSIRINNNTNCNGTLFVNTTGNVENIVVRKNRKFGYGLHTINCNCSFGKAVIVNNTLSENAVFINNSNVNMEMVRVTDITFEEKNHAVMSNESDFIVDSVDIKNVSVFSAQTLRLRKGNLTITHLYLRNNTVHQVLLQSFGRLFIMHGIIHKNINKNSTLIGSVNASLFALQNINFTNNVIGERFFHLENITEINCREINIFNNKMNETFHILKSNVLIDNVAIKNNIVQSRGKVLSFTDEKEKSIRGKYNVTITNVHSYFEGFHGTYESNNYFELDMRNSNLTMKNNSIRIENVYVPSLKVIKLAFATNNPNFHPKINVICPTNYDVKTLPAVKNPVSDYEVNCQRCLKDTYSLSKGRFEFKDINKTDIDTTWVKRIIIDEIFITEKSRDLECLPCPTGGDCLNGTRSQGNYYGFENSKKHLKFISCPAQYCCSKLGEECISFNTCNTNRKGTLCGSCAEGFYESLFSHNCVHNEKCTNEKQLLFWLLFTLSAVVLTFMICCLKDILTLLRYLLKFLKSVQGRSIDHNMRKKETVFVIQSENKFDEMEAERSYQQDHSLGNFRFNGIPYKNECYDSFEGQEYTIAGVLQIIIKFFQIDALMSVTLENDSNLKYKILSDTFNLELLLYQVDSLCPFHSIGAVGKLLFRKILLFVAMIVVTTVSIAIAFLIDCAKSYFTTEDSNITFDGKKLNKKLTDFPFRYKLALTYLKIIMFAYKNITFVSVTLMTCPTINNVPVLYINGNIRCYQEYWQLFNYMLFVFWIIPFPLALTFLYYLMKKEAITMWSFLICLAVPIATPYWYYKGKNQESKYLESPNHQCECTTNNENNLNIECEILNRLYTIFEEPYRKRGSLFWWVSFGLYERLIIAIISTTLTDPTIRLCVVNIVVIMLLWLHVHLKPYKKEMSFLTILDTTAYICLSFHATINLFRAVVYNFDLSPTELPVRDALVILGTFGYIMTPLTVLLVYIVYRCVVSVQLREYFVKKIE